MIGPLPGPVKRNSEHFSYLEVNHDLESLISTDALYALKYTA
jgi:hypothetical protein